MLDELTVANLGLIESAHLEPGAGLVVVTGETGAGKTLLLGAIRLLAGEQARRDQIGPYGDEARVEGRFVDGEREVIAARRLMSTGRSKAYVDGSMVSLSALQDELGGRIELVAQHESMLLRRSGHVRSMIDARLSPDGRTARADYGAAWSAVLELEQRLAVIGGDARALTRELEMLDFQIDEIDRAGFTEGEDVELLALAGRLRNATAIIEQLAAARSAIDDTAADALGLAADSLARAARLDPSVDDLFDRVASLAASLGDVSLDLARAADDIDTGEGALDGVERRVEVLGDLQRKYGDSLDAVLGYAAGARRRADDLRELLAQTESISDDLDKARLRIADAGEALTAARRACAAELEADVTSHLRDLGFSSPVVRFELTSRAPGPEGADTIDLLFASDVALTPAPVAAVASGGELSRLVLALRLAAGVSAAETIAFDEIDAGVGGATALAMGEKLATLASGRQVLCVTHLPQVAAFGSTHYVIEREGNSASVRQVAGDERVAELSRMLAGLPDSERGREHAAELLARVVGQRTPE